MLKLWGCDCPGLWPNMTVNQNVGCRLLFSVSFPVGSGQPDNPVCSTARLCMTAQRTGLRLPCALSVLIVGHAAVSP